MKTFKERMYSIYEKAEAKQRKRKKITIISILSSVAAAILAFNLVLFVPYTVGDTDISRYKSSAYYGVIQKLYPLTYSPSKTTNFFQWFGSMFMGGGASDGNFPTSPGDASDGNHTNNSSNSYRETTLNQTDGVIEGDLFKRSDTHIFYLDHTISDFALASYMLKVYTIAGENSSLVAEYEIKPDSGTTFNGSGGLHEMYLSEDLSDITVISPCYDTKENASYTTVINIDVSNLSNIEEKSRTYISGRFVSSRVADGSLLIISNFTVPYNVDFDKLSLYVPHVGMRGQMKPLLSDNIVCPDNATSPRYTVICSLNNEREVTDSVALMSFSDDVYVSQNNIFATRAYTKTVYTHNEYDLRYTHSMTEIRIVPYGGGEFGKTKSVAATGSVLNRYSLDEYNGMLRAVTTVNFFDRSYTYKPNEENPYPERFTSRCMLYCYDLTTLEIVANVEDFAPAGESVMSARFYGDTAYVCTAKKFITITDPVFAFDLSDLNNITYTDTGTIPGYSLSLNSFTDNTLLGIGYGEDTRTLKIELYRQTENNVESVAKYEEDSVVFSPEFKAHLIDAKNGIIGLGISSFYGDKGARYALFRYDGYDLAEIASVKLQSSAVGYTRATVIDSYVYIFENDVQNTANSLKVIKLE